VSYDSSIRDKQATNNCTRFEPLLALGRIQGFAGVGAVDAVGGGQAIQVVVAEGLTAGATELAGRRHGEGVPQPQDVADGVVLVGQGLQAVAAVGCIGEVGAAAAGDAAFTGVEAAQTTVVWTVPLS